MSSSIRKMLHQQAIGKSSADYHRHLDRMEEVRTAFLEGMLLGIQAMTLDNIDEAYIKAMWLNSKAFKDLGDGPPIPSARRGLKPTGTMA